MIDITKLGIHPNPSGVTTREGREVRIYAVDAGGDHRIHGAILCGDRWIQETWTTCGLRIIGLETVGDLIPAKQRVRGWVTVLGKPSLGIALSQTVFKSQVDAIKHGRDFGDIFIGTIFIDQEIQP